MKKRWWIIAVVIVLLVVVAYFALPLVMGPGAAATQPAEAATVRRGPLLVTVKATGSLVSHTEVSVAATSSGRVAEVLVEEGTVVTAGQPLLRLDTADLEMQVAQAQASLALAEANLTKTLSAANPADVRVARSNLSQAQTNLDEQRATLAASTEQARLSWVEAANTLRDAQASYENIYWENRELEEKIDKENMPDEKIDAEAKAWRAVENAETAMERARLSYEQARQRQDATISTAQDQVTTANANLQKLTDGPATEDIAVSQASVKQARLSVEQAQAQLDKATLTAPQAGTVTTVNVQVGEWANMGQPVIVLSDLDNLEVEVNLDETDVARVTLGQQVQIAMDALPDARLTGQVTRIAPTAQTQVGVVLYPVTIHLEKTTAPVRPGMTAEATIVTASRESTLLVPLRSIETVDGQAYVRRITAGQVERVEVTLGLMNDSEAEISAGLAEGDVVAVDASPVQRSQMPLPRFLGGQ